MTEVEHVRMYVAGTIKKLKSWIKLGDFLPVSARACKSVDKKLRRVSDVKKNSFLPVVGGLVEARN